jgi:glyoxylase I family protein
MTEPTLSGTHHISLNVHDPERSEQWYADVLNFSRLGAYSGDGFHRIIMHHPSGIVLGLSRHQHPEADVPFSERRTGLDHLAFQVGGREQLEAWIARFDAHGVDHSEMKPAAIPGTFLVAFRDPDGIQLELFAPAQANSG